MACCHLIIQYNIDPILIDRKSTAECAVPHKKAGAWPCVVKESSKWAT